jgi:hypothetical protein
MISNHIHGTRKERCLFSTNSAFRNTTGLSESAGLPLITDEFAGNDREGATLYTDAI